MKIKSINKNILKESKKFYDISVPEYENFVVGEKSKIVVHNSSLNGAIIGMAQSFKNSMPLLQEFGQFGSLRSPEAGAPRYISTALHKNFRLLYKDFELLESKYEEGIEIEPNYFLPIVPTVLLNGSAGIAVGFATNILNRNLKDLIDACLDCLDDKKIKELKPHVNGFTGTFEKDPNSSNRWIISGKHVVVNTSTVTISELVPSMTYEKFEIHLNKLMDEKKLITSYEDNCSGKINYEIKFRREVLENLLKTNKLKNHLKLEDYETENLIVLDEFGKIKKFETVSDIVKYFVNFRLSFYQKRKNYLINKLESELFVLKNKANFIKGIIDKKILVNNVPKSDIISQLEKLKFDKIEDSYNYLLYIPIHNLSKEKYDDLVNELEAKKKELEIIKALVPKDMYKKDLNDLKATIK